MNNFLLKNACSGSGSEACTCAVAGRATQRLCRGPCGVPCSGGDDLSFPKIRHLPRGCPPVPLDIPWKEVILGKQFLLVPPAPASEWHCSPLTGSPEELVVAPRKSLATVAGTAWSGSLVLEVPGLSGWSLRCKGPVTWSASPAGLEPLDPCAAWEESPVGPPPISWSRNDSVRVTRLGFNPELDGFPPSSSFPLPNDSEGAVIFLNLPRPGRVVQGGHSASSGEHSQLVQLWPLKSLIQSSGLQRDEGRCAQPRRRGAAGGCPRPWHRA